MTSPIEKADADSAACSVPGLFTKPATSTLTRPCCSSSSSRRRMLSGGAASFSTGSSEKGFPASIAASSCRSWRCARTRTPDRPALQALTAALKILDQADNLEETDPATVQVLKHTGSKTECLRARLGAAADGQLRMEGKSSSARPP